MITLDSSRMGKIAIMGERMVGNDNLNSLVSHFAVV